MVTDIINLIGADVGITNILLKTLTFAHRIGNDTLKSWVKNELDGYPIRTEMPVYRYVRPVNIADITDGYKTERHPLPITYLSEGYRKFFINRGFYESIGALEEMSKMGEQMIEKTFSPDLLRSLNADIAKNKGTFKLVGLKQLVVATEIAGIITSVKAKLLELLLEIESEAGEQTIGQINITNKDTINQIVNNYMTNIINVSGGEGNVINTGKKNNIKVSNNITKGDLASLIKKFEASGVDNDDLNEISAILEIEGQQDGDLGTQTKGWIGRMLSKAAEGAWKIGISVAAGLLEGDIKRYLGLPS